MKTVKGWVVQKGMYRLALRHKLQLLPSQLQLGLDTVQLAHCSIGQGVDAAG